MSVSASTSEDFSPHHTTLKHASLIAMKHDIPIMLYYYSGSFHKQCKLVKTQDKDTILYKSQEEYTSPLQKLFKIDSSAQNGACDMIAISENSIYLVHSNVMGN